MHVRTRYAAVSDETPSADANLGAIHHSPRARPTQTLWAQRPLHVQGGRLVAARLCAEQLQVGLVSDLTGFLRWVRPESIVSEQEAQRWVRSTRFQP